MYDLVKTIINHIWDYSNATSTTEQQLVYYICGAAILLFTIWILDRISVFIISCAKGGK